MGIQLNTTFGEQKQWGHLEENLKGAATCNSWFLLLYEPGVSILDYNTQTLDGWENRFINKLSILLDVYGDMKGLQ